MYKTTDIEQTLIGQRLLPLFYHDSPEVSVAILGALYDAGVRVVEYTNRGASALANFVVLRQQVNESMPGLLLGIGTIKNEAQALDYINAGADFIICPSMHAGVGAVCANAGKLWIPGCMPPTEFAAAENAGATLVKIFPGNLLGPSYISSIRDLFPGLRFLVTGGVEAEEKNLQGWFRSGVSGVGMGSKLITKELVLRNDFDGLKAATARALELVKDIH